jgi:hypothetical protein
MGVEFEGEQEEFATEALADRMVKQVAEDYALVGKTVERVVHDTQLYIKFTDGSSVLIEGSGASGRVRMAFNNQFSSELIGENDSQARQAQLARGEDPMRAEGRKLMSGSPTKPEQIPSHEEYPKDPPTVEGTEMTQQI